MALSDVPHYINTFIYDGSEGGFMYNDIRVAIDSKIIYLAALGLLTYTEYIGSLMPPFEHTDLTTKEKLTEKASNFYNFYYRMGLDYVIFDRQLREFLRDTKGDKGVYTVYRGGLAHAYFIGGNLKVGSSRLNLSSTVLTTSNKSLGFTDKGQLGFATEKYFQDFTQVIKDLRVKVLDEKDREWTHHFLTGANLDTHGLDVE